MAANLPALGVDLLLSEALDPTVGRRMGSKRPGRMFSVTRRQNVERADRLFSLAEVGRGSLAAVAGRAVTEANQSTSA